MVSFRSSFDVIRDRSWQVSVGLTTAAVLFAFGGVVRELLQTWTTKVDYSHGLLIVPFMGYLLWTRRDTFPATIRQWPDWRGLPFVLIGGIVVVVEERLNIAKEWVQAAALTLALAGIVVMFCGRWAGLRWAIPALMFLPLAFELPAKIGIAVTNRLQAFAAEWGNYVFQALGFPSYLEGNIIIIGDTRLGVEQACSGLSMILAFVALAGAIAMLYRSRPTIDRCILFFAAVPIALFCNILRIVITGLCYHAGWTKLADAVVHDLAGWLMMPLALAMLWFLVKLMDWITEPADRVSMTEALGIPKPRKPMNLPPADVAGGARADTVRPS